MHIVTAGPYFSIFNNCLHYCLHKAFLLIITVDYKENHHNKYLYLRISVMAVVYVHVCA